MPDAGSGGGNRVEDEIISTRTVLYLLEALDEKQLRQVLGRMKEGDPEKTVIESFWNRIHAGYEGERMEDLFKGALGEAILAYIRRAKMKPSDIYNRMGISRQQWHSHMKGKSDRFQDIRSILKIVIILHLKVWDAVYLLHLNGYSYPRVTDRYSRIVMGYIEKDSYNVQSLEQRLDGIDKALYDAGLETFFSEI